MPPVLRVGNGAKRPHYAGGAADVWPEIYSDDGSIRETEGPDEPPMSEVLTAVAQLPDAILAFALRE